MEKILITGVGGFLGRHIAKEFFLNGYSVTGIGHHSEGYAPNEVLTKYVEMRLPGNGLDQLFESDGPFLVIHCAGRASVGQSLLDPRSDYRGNTDLTFHLLEVVRRVSPDSRFLLLSSAAVYGQPSKLPVSEDAPLKPLSPYGFHKMMAEIQCREYYEIFGIETAVARIFSAYGPGLRRQLIWDICMKIADIESTGAKLHLRGTGDESRDFIFASDVAKGLRVIVEKGSFTAESYNLASGRELTVRSTAERMLASSQIPAELTFDGIVEEGTPSRWQADIEKIAALSFEIATPFDEGIEKTMNWAMDAIERKA